ncbi:MAG: MerR family transcriptional regulator [Proteobacteria bacterium]|nr:MerR family transcriptional regulator [Pseudomonadota bacterium]
MDPVIPDKMYFKIGEVSEITGLESHVLRFWESEFKNIKPRRTSTGQRMYRKNDIQLILYIKHLLHNEKFTIQGARKYIESESSGSKTVNTAKVDIAFIRNELEEILKMLE